MRRMIEVTTLADHLDRAAERWSHDALVFPHARVTFPELSERAEQIARSLRSLGVGPGETVAILMPNSIDYQACVYGTAKLGALPIPVNARFKSRELGHVLRDADVRVLITSDVSGDSIDYPALLREALPSLRGRGDGRLAVGEAPALHHLVHLGAEEQEGFVPRDEFLGLGNDVEPAEVRTLQARVRVKDTAMIMYTSGTTANPKGCMLGHESLVRTGYAFARERFFLGPDDRFWDPLPFFHMSTVLPLNGCLASGATFCAMEWFDPGVALDQLEQERCTVAFPSFETVWLAVLNHPRFPDADLSQLRIVNNVGVPERLEEMQRKVPQAVQVSAYGMTEGGGVICFNPTTDPLERRLHTCGPPFEGVEVQIVDPETLAVLPVGERGEICFRGYTVFDGYYGDPEHTASSFLAGGWFRSGDLGVLDDEGRVSYQGRVKDMLKVGGENVAAAEIEDFLAHHPAVQIVQVVGTPDSLYVEVPVAYVQLKPGASATEEELIDFCVGKIATYKVPRYVRLVNEWPMGGTKIQKFRLRERIAQELADRGISEAPRITSRGRA